MLRPISSVSNVNTGKNTQPEEPKASRKGNGDYEEKLKLAALLHDQGVNPELWQEAEPAPWTAQKRFRETGEAPEDMFVAQGRLYRNSPAIAASRTQGAASLNAFLGETPKPITDLVPVEKVQLRHPLGNKPDNLPAGDAALDRYRRYANLGVDPDQAHEGDAIPHHLQDGLKGAVTAADGNEIPLGIPGVYRNPDDGMFYLAHSGTEERDAVKDLRRRLALEKAERAGSADPIAANDNDPEIDEAVARFYFQEAGVQKSMTTVTLSKWLAKNYHTYISAITKIRQNQKLSDTETDLCKKVSKKILQYQEEYLGSPQVSKNTDSGLSKNKVEVGNALVTPGMWDWLLELFRGNKDGGACPKPDCDEVYRHCLNLCLDMFSDDPNSLPGEGSDMRGRVRRCTRECMEAHGCFDY